MNKVKNENSTQTKRWDNIHPIAIHPTTCTPNIFPTAPDIIVPYLLLKSVGLYCIYELKRNTLALPYL
jgi:hypothetical protein